MIDLRDLRENPHRYQDGANLKNISIDIQAIIALDKEHRSLLHQRETKRANQKKLSKEIGPKIGALKAKQKNEINEKIKQEINILEKAPATLKNEIQNLDLEISKIEPQLKKLLLLIPLPPDDNVPRGINEKDNIEISQWHSPNFNPQKTFQSQRGFLPKSHVELLELHNLVDFQRGVKIAGSRHYTLRGDAMRLHQAVLQFALQLITTKYGFTPISVPVIVRKECMEGTGFFPHGKEQAYHIEEEKRGSGHDLFLTGTGEVSLMALHADEIFNSEDLPIKYATLSTCFRREAGAAGRDTSGLYRIHQFDKVEQVIICNADKEEEKHYHKMMIGIVEELLQALELPYRLIECCTGDLGAKNAAMIDIESWMPSRGELLPDGSYSGAWGETHSASRLHDFQCRRLNTRYKKGGATHFCYSLNNTVVASPRILIPLIEIHQQKDGSINIPKALRPLMNNKATISFS